MSLPTGVKEELKWQIATSEAKDSPLSRLQALRARYLFAGEFDAKDLSDEEAHAIYKALDLAVVIRICGRKIYIREEMERLAKLVNDLTKEVPKA